MGGIMRIAIYTDILSKDKTTWFGRDWFIYEIIHRITITHPEHAFIIVSKESFETFPFHTENVKTVSLESSRSTTFSFYRLLNWKLPILLKKEKIDLLLSLNGFLPLKSTVPSCLVVRDISFLINTNTFSNTPLRYLYHHFPRYLSGTSIIAAVSFFCKKELVNQFKIPEEKIRVIQQGICGDYHPLNWQEREEVKNEHTDGREYFIYAGKINQEKNIINMLKGFSVLKKRLRSNMVLILAGNVDPEYKAFPELMRSYHFRDDVKRIGHAGLFEMTKLIGAAYGLVSPSVMKSFDVSVLEALHCRVPVLAASNTVAAEIAGDAALYFNPFKPDDIGDKFCELYKDESLRAMLISQADKQASQFNWEKTSDALWNCMMKIAKEP